MRKCEVIEPRKSQQIEVDTLRMVVDNNMQTILARMHRFYRGHRARRVSKSCIYDTREVLYVPHTRYMLISTLYDPTFSTLNYPVFD